MIRLAAIILALASIGVPNHAWSRELEAIDEQAFADRPSREWKYSDLEADVEQPLTGRSFNRGQQIFEAAQCNVCHRMNGEGNEFAPDLASLDRQWTPAKILRHTLEPSFEINKQYRTHIFELQSGRVINGLITAVGLNSVKVIEDPLANKQPRTIKTTAIQQRRFSRQSIMPSGLLDKLIRSEILDLMAYVYAGGNDRHVMFEDEVTGQ